MIKFICKVPGIYKSVLFQAEMTESEIINIDFDRVNFRQQEIKDIEDFISTNKIEIKEEFIKYSKS